MSKELKQYKDWSATERGFAQGLDARGVKFKYEPETIDLIETFNGTLGRVKPTFYTPDFAVKNSEGEICIIETKGFARGRDHIIFKLADRFYSKKGWKYYVVTQAGTKKNNNRDYYLYHSKGVPKRGLKARTIWDILGYEEVTNETREA